METRRLYFDDSYCTKFSALVVAASADETSKVRVQLNETYFYPTSGGQNNDTGILAGYPVVDVIEEGPIIWHIIDCKDKPTETILQSFTPGCAVEGEINWDRRFDHMQQHSGQHLLSALLERHYGVYTTSVHLGQSVYIDFDNYDKFNSQHFREVEKMVAQAVFENRPVTVEYEDKKSESLETRSRVTSPSASKKEKHGRMRYIVIEGIDRNGCCGTHVSRTGEIGPILFLQAQRYRGGSRITYVIGQRCVDTIQEHRDSLNELSNILKSNPQSMPALVLQHIEKQKMLKKECESLRGSLAAIMAERLVDQTPTSDDGLRRIVIEKDEIGDLEQAMGSTAKLHAGTVYVAVENGGAGPYKAYVAAASDTKIQCGKAIKELIAGGKGRGGGRPEQAQCSLETKTDAATIMNLLLQCRG